jgi:NitT/TauT family transport system substrate-binding protein
MDWDRRTFAAGLASSAFFAAFPGAQAQQLENLKLGVGNKSHLYYLPLTLAERRGHFKHYGLDVSIVDFEGAIAAFDRRRSMS